MMADDNSPSETPLATKIKALIRETGPISVADYMTLCLLDPVHGYYPTRDPLGTDGDFITAPEISQMFGEVLGLWCLQSWIDLGRPPLLHLIELGPGRGIMMSDILRTAKLDADFAKAVQVTLIEASPALEAVQGKTLANTAMPVTWANQLDDVPNGPSLILGNEFLDCLPIRQLVRTDIFAGRDGWTERQIGLVEGELGFVKTDAPIAANLQSLLPSTHQDFKKDEILEISPSAMQIVDSVAQRFKTAPGRALFIDYGPEMTEAGDTLQALKRHQKIGVFDAPGDSDLTARVDFAALADMAVAAGLSPSAAVPQREFLSKLGLEMRAIALTRAKPDAKDVIARQLHRLTAGDEMGELFKVMCLSSTKLPTPLGLRA